MKAMPSTLAAWLDYIQTIHYRSLDISLDRVRRVHRKMNLGRPSIVISVAGTNGKGSSVSLLEAIFRSTGKSVGIYTSPHLISYNERIRIDGVDASNTQITSAFEYVENARHEIPLTYFEYGTLTALQIFQQSSVDIIVLEVGMGGRLDAVNIEDPDVVLLTSIAIDHERWLGYTRDAIGHEKAGLLKPYSRAVLNDADVPESVIDRANALSCQYVINGVHYNYSLDDSFWHWTSLGDSPLSGDESNLPMPNLLGHHQVLNAAGVVATVRMLAPDLEVSRENIVDGLVNARLRGRIEVYSLRPDVVVDVCHNESAAYELLLYLMGNPIIGQLYAIFSMLEDKHINLVVDMFKHSFYSWHIARINSDRASSVAHLKNIVGAHTSRPITCWDSPAEALRGVRSQARQNDRIVVFGSTYLAGAILSIIDRERCNT